MGKNFIELNGKRYDALNGELLGNGTQPVSSRVRPTHQGRVVDGFVRPSGANGLTALAPKPFVAPATVPAPVVKRTNPKVVVPHQPQHAKTLMRRTVHKPEVALKKAIKTQAPAELAAKPMSAIVPKKSVLQVDTMRMARAKRAEQDARVQRFTTAQQNHPATPRPHGNVALSVGRPNAAVASSGPSRVRSTQHAATRQSFAQRPEIARHPKPAAPADVFEAALAQANSHQQPQYKPRRAHRKLINALSIVGAFVVIGGFVAYMNASNIEVHIASLQAGFHAQLPGYKPAGYALQGGVHATSGVVSVSYRSGDSSFSLQQRPSNWDSETLLDNVVALASPSHQTVQAQGRTVYVYQGNATWVSNGVLYSMKTGALSSDEISNIAASM